MQAEFVSHQDAASASKLEDHRSNYAGARSRVASMDVRVQ